MLRRCEFGSPQHLGVSFLRSKKSSNGGPVRPLQGSDDLGREVKGKSSTIPVGKQVIWWLFQGIHGSSPVFSIYNYIYIYYSNNNDK